MKRLLIIAAGLLVLVAGIAGYAAAKMNHFLHTPMSLQPAGADIVVESGSSFRALSDELEALGYISNSAAFRAWARWTRKAGAIHAGDYHIDAGTTPAQLLDQLTSGDVKLYSFTIIEGWNHRELLAALHAEEHIEATLTDEDWPGFLTELGATAGHPEGLFLPETYRFPRNTSDRDVLRQAYEHLQDVLQEEWSAKGGDLAIEDAIRSTDPRIDHRKGDGARRRTRNAYPEYLRAGSRSVCACRRTRQSSTALAPTSTAISPARTSGPIRRITPTPAVVCRPHR